MVPPLQDTLSARDVSRQPQFDVDPAHSSADVKLTSGTVRLLKHVTIETFLSRCSGERKKKKKIIIIKKI